MPGGIFRLPARPAYKLGSRLLTDAAMTLLFVSALAFRATGRAPHEWIGVTFAVLLGLHTTVNLGWYKALFKGRYGMRRTLNTGTNAALLASMATVCVTGVLQSRHVFGLSRLFDGETLRALHSLAAYWSMVFIGIHTGLHWQMVVGFFQKTFGGRAIPASRILMRLSALGVVLCGVWASFERVMGSKLFLGFSFDFWDPSRPVAFFYAANLALIGLYAATVHYALKGLAAIPGRQVLPQSGPANPARPTRPSRRQTHIPSTERSSV